MFLCGILTKGIFIISCIVLVSYFCIVTGLVYLGFARSLFVESDWTLTKVDVASSTLIFKFDLDKDYNFYEVNEYEVDVVMNNEVIGKGSKTNFGFEKSNEISVELLDMYIGEVIDQIELIGVKQQSFRIGLFDIDIGEEVKTLHFDI
ncbi:Late embryogenesis abundant protein LEA-2 subgroup domain-containing protein [Entamoeba marina]